jgi:hypothetical protein
MLGRLFALAATAALPAAATGDPVEVLGPHLAQVRSFAETEGERLWVGYGSAPFGFLLVTDDKELLLCRDQIPDGFTPAGKDGATGCDIHSRDRSGMPNTLLAAMPMFGPPSVIVMGTPESTGRSDADWVRTILHEHFHQWQNALPDYYPRTLALDLTGGDQTGMWMLNYPFPYDDADVVEAHAAASQALADVLDARGTPDFYPKFDAYLQSRRALEAAAGADNWRYAELQLWQEGVARWTEIALGKLYADSDVASAAAELEKRTLAALRTPDLAGQKREFAYAYGAGEAMLMEACGSGWRRDYPALLELRSLLEGARLNCGRDY